MKQINLALSSAVLFLFCFASIFAQDQEASRKLKEEIKSSIRQVKSKEQEIKKTTQAARKEKRALKERIQQSARAKDY
jgi:hypothetical protein